MTLSPEVPAAGVPPRILIVDDDASQRSLLVSFLAGQGFETVPVESGERALAVLAGGGVAMMISDVRMAGLTGLDLLRLARKEHAQLPILMVTAYTDIRDAVEAIRDGAVDYLAKPADAEDVVRAMLGVLTSDSPAPPENPMSADRVRWEHFQRVYELCARNVSETARRLGMHRRTLQRILAKRAPR